MKNKKQYAVLGLGIFGSSVSKTLSEYNCEVIAIDSNEECVQRIAEIVSVAICGDITDINVLRNANINECDVAVVATGTHLEESILCVLNLKELGVPYVIAKAKNKMYKQILEKVGADKVITPEKEMGIQLAKNILNQNIIEMIDIDEKYSLIEMNTPKKWIGKSLSQLDIRNKYNINVLGIRKENHILDIAFSATYVFGEKDRILFIGDSKNLDFIR